MIAYFDTSALVKLLLDEPGSATARRAWSSARSVSGVSVLYAEARAALAATRRVQRLTGPVYEQVCRDLQRLWASVHVIVADLVLCEQAGGLAEQEHLRGYDAVHLAAALTSGAQFLVCGDGDLLEAGLNRGLGVIDARS